MKAGDSPPGWVVDAIAAVGAASAAYCGAFLVGVVAALIVGLFQGSGGLGAVSAGVSDPLVLAIAGSILANPILRPAARRCGGSVQRLHRAHAATLITAAALLATFAVWLFASVVPWPATVAAFFVMGVLLAVQFFLLAAILIAFIWRRLALRAV